MKLRALVFVAALVASCVPATEEEEPRGGVVVRLVPSAETAGQPFTSVDGWRVTIERVALRVMVFVMHSEVDGASYGGGGSLPVILTPSEACELKATAMETGPAGARVELAPSYSGYDEDNLPPTCNVDAEMIERFKRKAEGLSRHFPDDADFYELPNIVLIARAQKDGRTVRLELALNSDYIFDERRSQPVTVVANQGALIRTRVNAAALFVPSDTAFAQVPGKSYYFREDPYPVPFDDVAASDENGDGIITGEELGKKRLPCGGEEYAEYAEYEDDYPSACGTLATALTESNAPYLFTAAP